MSELRTQEEEQRLEELGEQLDNEWPEFWKRREIVSKILSEIQYILKRDRSFTQFLRSRRIPRSTAYDLIADHQRVEALPEIVQEAAKRSGVDLYCRKYKRVIQEELPFLPEKPNMERATAFIHLLEMPPAGPPKFKLSLMDKQLTAGFNALVEAVGNVPKDKVGEFLTNVLGYAMVACNVGGQITATPVPPPLWIYEGRKGEPAA